MMVIWWRLGDVTGHGEPIVDGAAIAWVKHLRSHGEHLIEYRLVEATE